MCMHVHLCVSLCVSVCACMYLCMYLSVHSIHICMCVYLCVEAYLCACLCVHVYLCVVYVSVCMCICVYLCVCVHMGVLFQIMARPREGAGGRHGAKPEGGSVEPWAGSFTAAGPGPPGAVTLCPRGLPGPRLPACVTPGRQLGEGSSHSGTPAPGASVVWSGERGWRPGRAPAVPPSAPPAAPGGPLSRAPHSRALTGGTFVAEPGVGGPSSRGGDEPWGSMSFPARQWPA